METAVIFGVMLKFWTMGIGVYWELEELYLHPLVLDTMYTRFKLPLAADPGVELVAIGMLSLL
jgi:hypothetical protein